MRKAFKNYKAVLGTALPLFLGVLIAARINLSYQIIIVKGDSMKPTLKNGQIVIIDKNPLEIEADDVIVFSMDDEYVIKRVFGVPGDTIQLSSAGVIINDVIIRPYEYSGQEISYVLGDDKYFVLGDNHFESVDSRVFGPVSAEQIIGKML